MKKVLKSLSLICLAVLMVCPLMLAGCAKNYTISVQMTGHGQINQVTDGIVSATNVVGANKVKEGAWFEVAITPDTGYTIAEVLIDGEKFTETYEKTGFRYAFEDVSKNHTIAVTFEAIDRHVRFECLDEGSSVYVLYNQTLTKGTETILQNGIATVKHGSVLNLAEDFAYGTGAGQIHWVVWTGTQEIELAPQTTINGDLTIRVNMTKAQLDAILLG